MKFDIKLFLASVAIPAGLVTFSGANLSLKSENMIESSAKPYVVEVVSTSGERTEFTGLSKSANPYNIALELGAAPFPEDKFATFPEIRMNIGSKITVYRAPEYTIVDAKKKTFYRSWVKTVGELITESRIPALGKDDKANFPLETPLEDRMQIKITRVAKTVVVEPEVIKYSTAKKLNPNMEKGTKNVLQAGKNGSKNKYYLVTREDGVETSRKFQKSEVTAEPIEEILEVGTKVVIFGTGKATWYGWPSMEKKNPYYAAHKTLPKGTEVWVVNTANGKGVKVTILDRVAADVEIDLSPAAFKAIGSLGAGVINVRVEKYYPE